MDRLRALPERKTEGRKGGLHPIGADEPSAMKKVERQRKRRVLVEAKKLDAKEERALAEDRDDR